MRPQKRYNVYVSFCLCVFAIVAARTILQPLYAQSTKDIDVLHYRADIRITPSDSMIAGNAAVTVRNAGNMPMNVISLHLVDMTVSGVVAGEKNAVYDYDGELLSVELATPLETDDTITLDIHYGGSPGNEGGAQPWGGCHWGDVSYFMGVGFRAPSVSMMRLWLPSNDVPDDKATFDVTFSVPKGLVVASSGLLEERHDDEEWSRFRWVERHPTATYLFTYAVSDYALIQDEWHGIPMEFYVPRSDSVKGVSYFSTVSGMMDAFTELFGPYPFDKVGYCVTPIGSMEHQTMISYAASLFQTQNTAGTTAAHELAHMWWGDWVTCRDFSDVWLNEGFAVFAEMVYAEYFGGYDAYRSSVTSASDYYRNAIVPYEGMLPLQGFSRAAPSSNYPVTIYNKGGLVLVMLRSIMGDDSFFEGLREYGRRHAYDNALTTDFQAVMEEYHGSDLEWFFDQWVFKPGYPVYTLQRVLDPSGAPLRLNLLQTQDAEKYPLYAMPMDASILLLNGEIIRRRIDTKAAAFQEIVFSDIRGKDVRHVALDPEGVVLKSISYRTITSTNDLVMQPKGVSIRSVYPNPVAASATIELSSASASTVELLLHDTAGRLLQRHSHFISAGLQSLHINTFELSPGAYTLTVLSPSGIVAVSLLVAQH